MSGGAEALLLDIMLLMHLPGVCHWVCDTSELGDLISFCCDDVVAYWLDIRLGACIQ